MGERDDSREDRQWHDFRSALERVIGVPLYQYKEPQMKRRLASLMNRQGITQWDEFAKSIGSDEALLTVVRDTLTINVSEFFRQPERFRELQDRVFPELLSQRPRLKIWSAGCSIGCEPYTLAMILNHISPGTAHTILATDVDMPAMSRAKDGTGYHENEVRSVPPEYRRKYIRQDGQTFSVSDDIKRPVTFRRHDLLKDPYPRDVDLILCRNVVIYFTDDAKRYIYDGFAQALRPGGYLFIGGSEIIMGSREIGLQTAATSLYQRAA